MDLDEPEDAPMVCETYHYHRFTLIYFRAKLVARPTSGPGHKFCTKFRAATMIGERAIKCRRLLMRGRKPRCLSLVAHDEPILEQIARSRTLPWLQVQRARAILAIARGERVQTVAWQMQCAPSTVWRMCRCYEQRGLEGLLSEAPRSGHPDEISPSAAGANRAISVSGANR